jgi:hypothetical protein
MLQATQARSLVGVQAIHDLHGALVLPALEPDKKRLCLVLAGAPYSWHTIPEHTDAFFSGWLGAYRAIKHLVETIHTYDSGRGVVYKVDYEETRLIGNWVAKLLENQEHSPETGIWIPFKEQTLRKVLQQLREYSAAKIET